MHLYYKLIVLQAWSDIKTKTKQKNLMLKKYTNKTGGGPRCDTLVCSIRSTFNGRLFDTTNRRHHNNIIGNSATRHDQRGEPDVQITKGVRTKSLSIVVNTGHGSLLGKLGSQWSAYDGSCAIQ